MSVNNINLGAFSMPQIAQGSNGQLYMITTNPSQLSYLFPKHYLGAPHMPQATQGMNSAVFQQPPQPSQQLLLSVPQQHQERQHHQQQPQLKQITPKPKQVLKQPPKAQPAPIPTKFPAHLKDQTNAKIKNVREKSITHYIDGLKIIETFKPPGEEKPRVIKRRKTDQHQGKDNDTITVHNRNNNFQNHSQQLNVAPAASQQQTSHSSSHLDLTQVRTRLESPMVVVKQPPPTDPLPKPREQQNELLQQPAPPPQSVKLTIEGDNEPASLTELLKLRAEMHHWSVSDVVKFIERHEDIKQYSSKFSEDEVDGKALLLMIDRNCSLRFQILTSMFKHGPAMKIEAILAKYKLNE